MSADLMDAIETELKANMAEMGLIDPEGRPTDEGAKIVQGQGHAPSPHTAILNTHNKSKKKKSRYNKKKNVKPDPTQPTDEDIHLKQQVVEDMCQAVKTGVHLKHVPYPEEDHTYESDSEAENEETESHEKNLSYDPQANLSDDDDLFDKSTFPTTTRKTHKLKSIPPSVFASLWRFCGIIQILPLILRCAFNTFLLIFISKTLSIYGLIFSRLNWFETKIENFLPLALVTALQFCTNVVVSLNGHINNYMDAKKQENEEKIQKTYDIIVSYSKNLVRDYQKIEDSVQDYSPTLRVRDNFNLFFVLSIRSIVWLTLPFFEYFKMRCQERKKGNLV